MMNVINQKCRITLTSDAEIERHEGGHSLMQPDDGHRSRTLRFSDDPDTHDRFDR
jgi:hypothetical protein